MIRKWMLVGLILVLLTESLSAEEKHLQLYVPDDSEIQTYMNFYEHLKAIDNGKFDPSELKKLWDQLEDESSRFYATYQRLLFEAYLLNTKRQVVRAYLLTFLPSTKLHIELSSALTNLYRSKLIEATENGGAKIRYQCPNSKFDENIDLFDMKEVQMLSNKLGLMLFTNNWTQVRLKDKRQTESESAFLVFGGGTNSMYVSVKEYSDIGEAKFEDKIVGNNFYTSKYENFQTTKLALVGVLNRSGADEIYLGVGNGADNAIPEIQDFSVVVFLYSSSKKQAFEVEYFMNISKANNNYDIRNDLHDHLIFQALLTYLN